MEMIKNAVCDEIADADLLATAVGASVLEKIAPVIARGSYEALG